MPKTFVVTQVYVRQTTIRAEDDAEALDKGEPTAAQLERLRRLGVNFSNWHAHEVAR